MDISAVKATLWKAADELRANSALAPSQYRDPVLGMIFLAYAEHRFDEIAAGLTVGPRNPLTPDRWKSKSGVYLPEGARLSAIRELPEAVDLAKALDDAMLAIEEANPDLKGVLPRGYQRLEKSTIIALLELFAPLAATLTGDAFGLIYEDFLGNFAMAEGRLGGEFFTPASIVRLIVEILEPFHGTVFDPACGSGGMFVQCAKFVERHDKTVRDELTIFGQEHKDQTVPIAKMNLALHGLGGQILLGNSYYDDRYKSLGRFDFVMANPPFNVKNVDKEKVVEDLKALGTPTTDNANYLWIQRFWSALSPAGRAGFVMANSASDARSSELEIRKKLLQAKGVDVMVAIGTNFFYTVTLPVTLWFLDKAKMGTAREDTVLFIDARHTFRQVDRAHRDFAPDQLELLANIVRLYRGEEPELVSSKALMEQHFPDGTYADVAGLCKVATLDEIEAQGWSLNPGRYTGTAAGEEDDEPFLEKLARLHEEFTVLSDEAAALRSIVDAAVEGILSA